MKKINYYLGALALAAMSLASCSSDEPMKAPEPEKVTVDQVRYLNITINNPSSNGSRADENPGFLNGSGDENFVKDLYFVFYDFQGNILSHAEKHFQTNTDADGFTKPGDNQSVDKIWSQVVEVQLSAGSYNPSYVMAFVNPVNTEILNMSLSALENAQGTQVANNDYKNFPMSNSVYYGTNLISGESNVRMVATPIVTSQLYGSATEASAPDAESVEIYVERYASRVDLTLAANAINPNAVNEENQPVVNGYTLQFVPEYWRPNAIDVNTYVIKHYALLNANGTINDAPTFDQLEEKLKWNWNAPDNFRSYWGCSPSYYNAKYPEVSDDVEDNENTTYNLRYFSYNQIKDPSTITGANLLPSVKYQNGFSGAFYARETTASSTAWQNAKDYNPAAVVASAVIVGRYKLTPTTTGATPLADNTTFYLYGKTDNKWNVYLDAEYGIINAMLANQIVVLDAAHNPIKKITDANKDFFTVDHPSKAVRQIMGRKVAGRFVALQLTADAIGSGLCYYDHNIPGDNKYVAISADNLDNVNANLAGGSFARKYGEGLAYFSIPIQHLGYKAPAEGTEVANIFATAQAGSFGLVRNHLYKININSIKGLATALRSPDQPIVPPMDEQTYYVSAKLNVLNWRLVNPQNVDL